MEDSVQQGRAKHAENLVSLLVGGLTLAFGLTASYLLWAKWTNFDPYLLDFSITTRFYERILGRIPFSYPTHYYTPFYMGLHLIVLPIYALFRSVTVIFAVHILSFTLAIPLLYLISRQVLPGLLLPLAVVIAYVLNPSVDVTVLTFLRQESFWMILFLLTVYLEQRRRNRLALLSALAACFVRMDAAPAIFLLGCLYTLQRKRQFGAKLVKGSVLVVGVMLLGMILFRTLTGISPDLQQVHMSALLDDTSPSAGAFFGKAIQTLLDWRSYEHFLILFQFLLLPLLAPLYLVPGLASALYIVLSSASWRSIPQVASLLSPNTFLVPDLHVHDSYLLPILFVAMVYGIRRLHDRLADLGGLTVRASALLRIGLATGLMILFFLVHWFFATPELGPIPLTPHFDRDHYRQTARSRLAWEVLNRIPKDQAGLMQFTLAERATRHARITEVYPWSDVTEEHQYAFFDLYAVSPNMPKRQLLEKIQSILRRNDFRVDFFREGILLLARGQADTGNQKVISFMEENIPALSNDRKPHAPSDLSDWENRSELWLNRTDPWR